jgi:ribosomal protein RSM22 (predicted rRNA methylase)
LEKNSPMRELELHDATEPSPLSSSSVSMDSHLDLEPEISEQPVIEEAVEEQLRAEAYHWPRLIFPPLKKGGHIILDSCTPEGHIMRLTIPRSQGKQEYYDARKSDWGDIFPHPPKNRPQVRVSGSRAGKDGPLGNDIGKRKRRNDVDQNSYGKLSESIKGSQQERKRRQSQREKRDLVSDNE